MPEQRIFMFGIKSKACTAGNLGTSETPRSARCLSSQEALLAASLPYATWIPVSAAALLDDATGMSRKGPGSQSSSTPKSISKKSWRKHGGSIPRFRSCWKRPIFTENSWDYWDHGPIQRKMLELREKVPLKSSEEKCCVLQ